MCSRWGNRGPGNDRPREEREFEYLPLWGLGVFFVYWMRRVKCRGCGVRVEQVLWGIGKYWHTKNYQWYMVMWAQRPTWKARSRTCSERAGRVCVRMTVSSGLNHREMKGVKAIGID